MSLILIGSIPITPELAVEVRTITSAVAHVLGGEKKVGNIIIWLGNKPLKTEKVKGALTVGLARRDLQAVYVWMGRDEWRETLCHELAHILAPRLQETQVRAMARDLLKWVNWVGHSPGQASSAPSLAPGSGKVDKEVDTP